MRRQSNSWRRAIADSDGRVVRVAHGQYKWELWPTYEEWLKFADDEPRQSEVWRLHELIAREHRALEDLELIDLGGEA